MLHLVPRSVARERGFRKFFTGVPCPGGHISERWAGNKNCIACAHDRDRRRREAPGFVEARSAYDRQRWETDRLSLVAKNRAYYAANADAVNAQKREYWAANKSEMASARRDWRDRNRHVVRSHNAARKAHIKRATPPWADMEAIKAVYAEADRLTVATGVEHHVDHIVPLKGELVCGLHVHWNLQPLPWRDNISKKNKFDVLS